MIQSFCERGLFAYLKSSALRNRYLIYYTARAPLKYSPKTVEDRGGHHALSAQWACVHIWHDLVFVAAHQGMPLDCLVLAKSSLRSLRLSLSLV